VTIAHELFHAAQGQLAGPFTNNWWYEATATWAERLFYKLPTGNLVKAVTDHPGVPMDAFNPAVDGAREHQYGAWSFVAWLFSRGKIK
jgi:hypothetical protein